MVKIGEKTGERIERQSNRKIKIYKSEEGTGVKKNYENLLYDRDKTKSY